MTIEHGIGAATAEVTIYPEQAGRRVGTMLALDGNGIWCQYVEVRMQADDLLDWRDRMVTKAKSLGLPVNVTWATIPGGFGDAPK